ncbi:carbamoyltransferase C-terminal domain-containing protein [Idiomarina sp.]|uniref:carbamoyltransferase family protein n=1 Tax=Idiomarina sp. TaxID=1874361 RepID=UPI0025C5B3BA|nr:carbamoyltransferase C-terminal domain-containing protein [Idiomarina sp.]NQZ04530.1 carbamoyl transferase [Idiomarina sp.]
MHKLFLGVAATVHDPAVAIMDESGELLFAEALERPMQHKIGWDLSPVGMFSYLENVLKRFHTPDTTWQVGVSWRFDAKKGIHESSNSSGINLSLPPNSKAIPDGLWGQWLYEMQAQYLERLDRLLPFTVSAITQQPNLKLERFDHHLTHAANACYFYHGSEPALVLIVDGEGEIGSLSCYELSDGQLSRVGRSWGPGSLGGLYGTITNVIGFDLRKGEEWKVMGLSAYGEFDDAVYHDIKQLVSFKNGSLVACDDNKRNEFLRKYSAAKYQYDEQPQNAANVAYAAQKVFEEIMMEVVSHFQSKTGHRHLILGGGCALNSRFNGLLSESQLFESVFVSPAPGDDGNAVGVAALLHNKAMTSSCLGNGRFTSPYLGSTFSPKTLERFVQQHGNVFLAENDSELCDQVAKELADGKLVAWVQGRSEFGPRALGNRSILANPSVRNTKDIINSKIKFREGYRPFAPAIMNEYGDEWFEHYQEWPYMGAAITWKQEKCEQVPGVVHADRTGRVQSVSLGTNPLFYKLLSAFKQQTGIPILLNTSLNVMGKPIVNSVEDAVAVFFTSGLDVLVIDNYVFKK